MHFMHSVILSFLHQVPVTARTHRTTLHITSVACILHHDYISTVTNHVSSELEINVTEQLAVCEQWCEFSRPQIMYLAIQTNQYITFYLN